MSDNSIDYKKFYEEINGWKKFLGSRRRPKGNRPLPFFDPSEKSRYFDYVMKRYEVMQYELDHPLLTEEEKEENRKMSEAANEVVKSFLS